MCVLALAYRAHPRWQLVIAGNRDEFHARPAAPLSRWEEPDHVLAGRDIEAGGTWLGVSEQGRAAVVTNLRGHGARVATMASRGALVTDLLAGTGAHADPAPAGLAAFNPFNLLLADRQSLRFLSNRPEPRLTVLQPGIFGLSNGLLDEPWPKTAFLKSSLADWLTAGGGDPAALFAPLRAERVPGAAVPRSAEAEESLHSSVFIRNAAYGTRCSTVVAVRADGAGHIIERRFDPDGTMTGETALAFFWPPAG